MLPLPLWLWVKADVHLTEMAVRNYETDAETVKAHANFCGQLFEVFKKINAGEEKPLTCVAFWGVQDNSNASEYTYRMNGPHGGLITENYQVKTSFDTIHQVMMQ